MLLLSQTAFSLVSNLSQHFIHDHSASCALC